MKSITARRIEIHRALVSCELAVPGGGRRRHIAMHRAAAARSMSLVGVVVIAASAEAEPRDHALPVVRQKEALPDYQLIVVLYDGRHISLGT